jgi:hypothetical protein
VVGWLAYVCQDPKGVSVTVTAPLEVAEDQTFDLVIEVRNERAARPFRLSDIDIAEEYLKGFVIVRTDPAPSSNRRVPFDNSRSFSFEVAIPPKAMKSFEFELRAREKGFFRGDVDVCEGMRFLTMMAQTEVK